MITALVQKILKNKSTQSNSPTSRYLSDLPRQISKRGLGARAISTALGYLPGLQLAQVQFLVPHMVSSSAKSDA